MRRRILKGCAVSVVLGVLGFGLLFGLLWLEHRSEVTLPQPTGAFPVGRSIQDWTDAAGLDALAPVLGTKRELLVWIWYPAPSGPSAVTEAYLPARLRPKGKATGGANLWTLLTRDLSKVHGHSARDPEISAEQRSYPVLILRAGASAPVLTYSTLAEDLASHGYVVVGFDAPYRTNQVVFPDGRRVGRTEANNPEVCLVPDRAAMERCVGRVMTAWSGDIGFVLDRLARLNAPDWSGPLSGRLDLARVGVFGHSLGGAVAAQFCHDDPRCKAAVDIDGAPHGSVVQEGLRQPLLVLLSDHLKEADAESLRIKSDIQSMVDRTPEDRRLLVAIRGAFHLTFSDDGALLKSRLVRGLLRLTGKLGMDGRRQLAVTAYCLRTFFDRTLKGEGGSPGSLSSALYPEIESLE